MKNFIVLILAFISFSIYAQKPVRCGEAISAHEGTLVDSSSVQPQLKILTDHQLQIGATGQLSLLSVDGNFRMSYSIGIVKITKIEEGIITFEVIEKQGVMTINGVEKSNFKEGALCEFAEYVYDSPHLIETKWPNGNVKESGYRLCNNIMGEWNEYHENGTLKTRYKTDKNGDIDGVYIEYFDSKMKAVEGTYKYGKKTGLWTEYKPDGTINAQGYYYDGEKTGKWIEHDSSGKKIKKKY